VTCLNCGGIVPLDAEFCPICGTSLAGNVGIVQTGFSVGEYIKHHVRLLAGIVTVILVAVLLIFFLPQLLSKSATIQSSNTAPTMASFYQFNRRFFIPQGNSNPAPAKIILLSTPTSIPTIAIPPTETSAPPEPTRVTCPGAPPIQVDLQHPAQVTSNCGDYILMRLNPLVGTNAEQYLYPDDTINILDGPQCSNDVAFFLVEAPKYSKTGWVAEAEPDSKIYCFEPVP